MSNHPLSLFFVLGSLLLAGCSPSISAEYVPPLPKQDVRFDRLLAESADLTSEQLATQFPQREYLSSLTFDPAEIPFYEETVKQLQLTDAEQQMLRSQGFVSVDHRQHYSFGSLYYAIYTRDLPVLVTTDSILHALHRTFDDLPRHGAARQAIVYVRKSLRIPEGLCRTISGHVRMYSQARRELGGAARKISFCETERAI